MEYDYLVFIGRFEPFHNGHAALVRYFTAHGLAGFDATDHKAATVQVEQHG